MSASAPETTDTDWDVWLVINPRADSVPCRPPVGAITTYVPLRAEHPIADPEIRAGIGRTIERGLASLHRQQPRLASELRDIAEARGATDRNLPGVRLDHLRESLDDDLRVLSCLAEPGLTYSEYSRRRARLLGRPEARPLIDLDDAVSVLTGVIGTTPRWRFLTLRYLRKRVDRIIESRIAAGPRPPLADSETAERLPRVAGQMARYS